MKNFDLDGISIEEKLKLVDRLWESILIDEEKVSSPHWHKDVLAERKKLIDEGFAEFVSVDELSAE
ncbi:addiction module protein [Hippea alviniae]|uniref:addiction module protein n=1 Tax=Hippea alviniae TaxID=1279027 RepID=UPI0003B5F5D4|nr:addiction module protein [Hippea alviniae]